MRRRSIRDTRARRTTQDTRARRDLENTLAKNPAPEGPTTGPPGTPRTLLTRIPPCAICRAEEVHVYCTRAALRYTKCSACGHTDKVVVSPREAQDE